MPYVLYVQGTERKIHLGILITGSWTIAGEG